VDDIGWRVEVLVGGFDEMVGRVDDIDEETDDIDGGADGMDEDVDEMGEVFDVLEEGCVQQGPVQLLYFFLSFEVLRPEHLTWSQPKQDVQSIAVLYSGRNFEQMVQGQMSGPGFCSIPARISSSWSS
jgi:hypothetical protein